MIRLSLLITTITWIYSIQAASESTSTTNIDPKHELLTEIAGR